RSAEAHRLMDLVAMAPNRSGREIGEAVCAGYGAALEECLAAGMLHLEDGAIWFRHELARQAVEGALSPTRRRALHAAVLRALIGRGVANRGAAQASLARLVHHAAQAEDGALLSRFAPAAAKQASTQGAHRQAAAHLITALRHTSGAAAEQRAGLLDELSHEYYLTGQIEKAVQPCEAALAIWRALDRGEKVGRNLRRLSRLNWFLGRNAEAARHG